MNRVNGFHPNPAIFQFELLLSMTRALTRTPFHTSRLVRTLADLAVVESVEPGAAFAEKLGQWIDIAGAIALHAVHNASLANPSGADTPVGARATINEQFAGARAALERSITSGGLPQPGAQIDTGRAFEPYRRHYLAHQRDMDLKVPALRTKVRNLLAGASPSLKRLAALDEALAASLHERESKLLSTLPALLEKRFKHLRKTHQQALADVSQADDPDLWMKSGGWLARFCHELQTVLLAELDIRLQPALGLLEAFNHEKATSL